MSSKISTINLENPIIYIGKEKNNLISRIMSKYDIANNIKNIPEYINPQISEDFNDTDLLDHFIRKNRKKNFMLMDSKFSKEFYLHFGTKKSLTLISDEYVLNMQFGFFFNNKNEIHPNESYNLEWISPTKGLIKNTHGGENKFDSYNNTYRGFLDYQFHNNHQPDYKILSILNSGLSFIEFMKSDKQTKKNIPFIKQAFRTFLNTLQKETYLGDLGRYYKEIDDLRKKYEKDIILEENNLKDPKKYNESLLTYYRLKEIERKLNN